MAKSPVVMPVVAGGAIGKFGRLLELPLTDIARPVVLDALADAGISIADVEAAFLGNAFGGSIIGQESILAQILLTPLGFRNIPMHTVKNACSSGSDAVHLAWSSVASGQYECVLVLGAEKLTHEDRRKAFQALSTATDHPVVDESRSVFTDVNAGRARRYMETYGATARDFAEVAAKNRFHASLNERAASRDLMSAEEVLADRAIVDPLTRAMCSGIVDGAACVILMGEARARRKGIAKPTKVVASAMVSGNPDADEGGNATHRAAVAAYAQSGMDPRSVDIAEVHDATAPQELLDIEDLMFCGRGEAFRLLRDGATKLGGRIPVNTSGGLISRGHPVGATGVAQVVEIYEQLQGCAGARQSNNPKIGLAQMAGGLLGKDSAAATVHILAV
jgi:acetyl-CoA acetyltransferase